MTAVLDLDRVTRRPDLIEPPKDVMPTPPTHVEVLACGAADRGDDGAALIALGRLVDRLPPDVQTRIVGQLDIDDLLAVPKDAGVVVVDTALGVDPGWIVEIPFSGLAGRDAGIRPRSSHALSIPETVAVASIIRGHPLPGIVVAIGGIDFGLGEALSWPVAYAMDAFVLAIADAIGRVRALVLAPSAT
ncbi:MAG: hydrogenase maturation protease [Chloroflexota bacterium]